MVYSKLQLTTAISNARFQPQPNQRTLSSPRDTPREPRPSKNNLYGTVESPLLIHHYLTSTLPKINPLLNEHLL